MKVFAIGASKNIGYFSVLHILAAGHKVVFFLRSVSAFEKDATMKPFIESKQAILIEGDGLNKESVENAWKLANQESFVNLVLFTVGGTPTFNLRKGLVIDPPNLTTHVLSNVLKTIAAHRPRTNMPRLIAVTTTGATQASHDALPFGMKGFYSYALRQPHADKLGMERLLQHAMGKPWVEKVEPDEEILPSGWRTEYPEAGWLPRIVVVRPAFLTNGEEKGIYRASTEEFASWTVSRRDVAHFVGKRLLAEWGAWSGKIVNVGY